MKKFKINRRICGAVLAVIVACTGCKKGWLDVNEDPNRATDANITAELIFPQAAHSVGARLASGNLQFIQNWMGYMSASGDFAIQQDETTYNIDFTFGDVLWQNNYNVLFDLYLVKQKALAAENQVLAGAAMILSARLWQDMVDIYGNIPYSQAFQSNSYRQPAYDRAQDIYADLQKSLDTAITYMKAATVGSFNAIDIVNKGDKTLWTKFANTLKLRLLIRQSEMAGFNPGSEIAKIQANGGVLEAGQSIDANPGYVNENNKQSPFYANYGLTPAGAQASTSTRANRYFVNLLNTHGDPRIERFYNPPAAGGPITGTTYGLAAGNPDGNHSSTMGPGIAGSATQNQWIFPSFESMFLKAEAIVRGWLPGNAQTAYEAAVVESFVWLGVENAVPEAQAYLADADIANWANAGSTVLQQARFIAFQKYIALCAIDPVEAWSDLRRLNMIPDKGYISVNTTRTSIPVRLLYPQSEYTTNGDNVRAQGENINQFDSKIFWQP
ncbi:SusD/RagB family nutrient-binding outer membrane lipoprotein [Longitalea luteola]|uniref:SusD/RagB family nutrient-binding outer membrane lipoprotein n=1 Tax=Longitalea luteola TaxID=2812563 RepID=UPI001A95E4D7|nr:SusD/RagB family nutrient-binding outer membrane lipoprotein [Longitalea luteola]